MPKEKMLSTHDLKQRGWTDSMIRKLLPEHDDTRENHLNRNYGDVKLYREDRVNEAECTSAFAELLEKAIAAQERAARAQETIRERIERGIREHAAAFTAGHLKDILSQEEAEQRTKSLEQPLDLTLWDHHALQIWMYQCSHNLGKLHWSDRAELERQVNARVKQVFREVYRWAYPETNERLN